MATAQIGVRSAISSVSDELDGFSALKDEQTETLETFIDGKDVLALLPTGFGKSLIYQLAPLVCKKLGRPSPIVLVVSPLVALIEDQIREAAKLGVKAERRSGAGTGRSRMDSRLSHKGLPPKYTKKTDG